MAEQNLSPAMERTLRDLYYGREINAHCRTRSEHGGLVSTITALKRRGLIRGLDLTDTGKYVAAKLIRDTAARS